jgi:predicted enzyme related to lactoylglutathione lyase
MRLNQVTVTAVDLDPAWDFYCTLGLVPIVDARPHYARFYCPDGKSTFSLDLGDQVGRETTVYFECDDLDEAVRRLKDDGLQFASDPEDKSWLWREAELFDPSGNRVILYRAGENRLSPAWRLAATSPSSGTNETERLSDKACVECL